MMKPCKPYEPTMSKRKLHNLTEITEKNIGKVQGHLAKFFSKPTVMLQGFYHKENIKEIQEKELIPNYVPYEGRVGVHYLWKKHLAGDDTFFLRAEKDIPRLAISTKYNSSCVPIEIGDRYKLYGNRLVLMHKWEPFVHYTPWLRFKEFIHVNKHDPERLKQSRINGIVGMMYEDSYYLNEYVTYRTPIYIRNTFRDLADDLVYEICKCSKNILNKHISEGSCKITLDGEDYFILVVKVAKALDPNNNENYYELASYSTGKTYTSINAAIEDMLDTKIKSTYPNIANCEIDDDDAWLANYMHKLDSL